MEVYLWSRGKETSKLKPIPDEEINKSGRQHSDRYSSSCHGMSISNGWMNLYKPKNIAQTSPEGGRKNKVTEKRRTAEFIELWKQDNAEKKATKIQKDIELPNL